MNISSSNLVNLNPDAINAQKTTMSIESINKTLNRRTLSSQLFSPTTSTSLSKNAQIVESSSLKFASDLASSPIRTPTMFSNRKLSSMFLQGNSADPSMSHLYDYTIRSSHSTDSLNTTNNNNNTMSSNTLINKKNLKRKLDIDSSYGLLSDQNFSPINGLNKSISSINTISDNEEENSFNGYDDDDDDDDDRINEKENERSFSSDSLSNGYYTQQNPNNQHRHRSKSPTNSNSGLNTSLTLRSAPTLATGRKSKDTELPPDEARKRQDRRERNKEAAARCRRKREDLTISLTRKTEELSREADHLKRKYQELSHEKMRLENLLLTHEKTCVKSSNINITSNLLSNNNNNNNNATNSNNNNNNNNNSNSSFFQQQQQQQLLKIKKEELDEIIKQSQERKTQKIINQINSMNNNNNNNISPSQIGKMNGHLNLGITILLTPFK
jgi:hypothetical protein